MGSKNYGVGQYISCVDPKFNAGLKGHMDEKLITWSQLGIKNLHALRFYNAN